MYGAELGFGEMRILALGVQGLMRGLRSIDLTISPNVHFSRSEKGQRCILTVTYL
jgi:hypothetical protein